MACHSVAIKPHLSRNTYAVCKDTRYSSGAGADNSVAPSLALKPSGQATLGLQTCLREGAEPSPQWDSEVTALGVQLSPLLGTGTVGGWPPSCGRQGWGTLRRLELSGHPLPLWSHKA